MNLLPRRSLLAIAAVVDIAYHARPAPIAAKALSARDSLPPRHLETLLQALVRAEILKGVRGPRGGYELARERRRISAAEVIRAVAIDEAETEAIHNPFIDTVIHPVIARAGVAFLADLEGVTIDDVCREAGEKKVVRDEAAKPDFTI